MPCSLVELSKMETDELRKTHFDVFKCLSWLQTQAKDAKNKGTEVSLKDLLEKSSEFMVDESNQKIKKPRAPRKSKVADSELPQATVKPKSPQ